MHRDKFKCNVIEVICTKQIYFNSINTALKSSALPIQIFQLGLLYGSTNGTWIQTYFSLPRVGLF